MQVAVLAAPAGAAVVPFRQRHRPVIATAAVLPPAWSFGHRQAVRRVGTDARPSRPVRRPGQAAGRAKAGLLVGLLVLVAVREEAAGADPSLLGGPGLLLWAGFLFLARPLLEASLRRPRPRG